MLFFTYIQPFISIIYKLLANQNFTLRNLIEMLNKDYEEFIIEYTKIIHLFLHFNSHFSVKVYIINLEHSSKKNIIKKLKIFSKKFKNIKLRGIM